ncbi:uncharacterized protein [Montipora foliosa]|uniref:uncharacterized protein isoform X3 n=1 Tax=Montipora foliosa TaxID=591990 RepID=UPI0035F1D0BC
MQRRYFFQMSPSTNYVLFVWDSKIHSWCKSVFVFIRLEKRRKYLEGPNPYRWISASINGTKCWKLQLFKRDRVNLTDRCINQRQFTQT